MNKHVIQEAECQLRFGKTNQPTNHDTGGLWHVVLAVWRTAFPLRSLCQVMLFVNISQFGILKKKTRKYLDLNILASVG